MSMSEEARQKKNQYKREWNAKNKERVREYNRKYWEKKAREEPEVKA